MVVVALGLAGVHPVSSQRLPADRLEAAADFVERYRARLGLPGVTLTIATADSVLLARAFGQEDLTPDTPVGLGSVTKTLTAAAIAQLASRGTLDLDDPIEAHLPGFRMLEPFVPRSITLRHLLQHRSGFSQWSGHDPRAQREGRFDHLAPVGPPGAEGRYSSLNFIVLGRVMQAVTGHDYGDDLRELLFEPLHIERAVVAGDATADSTIGHQSWFGLQVRRPEPEPPPFLVPAGFVALSARDVGRYTGMLLGHGSFAGGRVLDSSAVAGLLGPLDTSGVSLGWGRRRVNGELILEHKGNARTTSARLRLFPERGYAISVLATTNAGPFFDATDQLMNSVERILEEGSAPAPWPRERIFKGLIFAGTALSVAGLVRQGARWNRAGRPVGLPSGNALGRLAFDVGAGALILYGVPRLIGVPLPTLVQYFPDLGLALGVSAGAGILGGVFRGFTASGRP